MTYKNGDLVIKSRPLVNTRSIWVSPQERSSYWPLNLRISSMFWRKKERKLQIKETLIQKAQKRHIDQVDKDIKRQHELNELLETRDISVEIKNAIGAPRGK